MKKFLIIPAAFLTAVLLLAGCSPSTPGNTQTGPESGGSNEPEAEILEEYEVWENESAFPEELPAEMRDTIQSLKKQRGYFTFNPQEFKTGSDLFIFISSGEKQTGGYFILLNKLEVNDNTLKITVEERKPSQENAVIQVLTYPSMLLKVKDAYESFSVKNTAGEAFLPIFPEEIAAEDHDTAGKEIVLHSAKGTLTGRIDSNSVEIEINGEPLAFYLSRQNLADSLTDGEKVNFDYYEDGYGRLVINKIEKDL